MNLLPGSASTLMRVIAETIDARLSSIPVPGPETLRPETAPESFLPFVAWGFSVDLWRTDWPLETKRAMAADSLALHMIKGTETGILRHLAYTKAQVLRVIDPPQDFFASAGPESDPSWRAWIESLPEVRLYQMRSEDLHGYALSPFGGEEIDMPDNCYFGAEATDEPTFFASAGIAVTDVEYAVMVERGVETPIMLTRRPDTRVGMTGDVIEYNLPGEAGAGAFFNEPVDGLYTDGSPAAVCVFQVALGPTVAAGEGWALVEEHNDRVQDVQPEAGMYRVVSPVGLFAGHDHLNDAILIPSDADWGTYQAIRLMRTDAPNTPAVSFSDADRLGIAPYTAEFMVEIPETVSDGLMFASAGFSDGSFCPPPTDLTELHFAIDAVEVSQSARDRLSLDLNIPPKASLATARRLSEIRL